MVSSPLTVSHYLAGRRRVGEASRLDAMLTWSFAVFAVITAFVLSQTIGLRVASARAPVAARLRGLASDHRLHLRFLASARARARPPHAAIAGAGRPAIRPHVTNASMTPRVAPTTVTPTCPTRHNDGRGRQSRPRTRTTAARTRDTWTPPASLGFPSSRSSMRAASR